MVYAWTRRLEETYPSKKNFWKQKILNFVSTMQPLEPLTQFESNLPLRKTALKFMNVIGPLKNKIND